MRARRWPESTSKLPPQTKVANALLLFLNKRSSPIEPKYVYSQLAELMGLASEQLLIKRADGRLAWPNLVQWARNYLVKEKLMNRLPKDQWSLTAAGRAKAEGRDQTIDEELWPEPH